MSIILEGIDMPKGTNGLSITFHSQDGVTETHILDATLAVQIPKVHGRLGDLDELNARMYHEAFETDTPLQKWDGGCWIRYKMFENCRDSTPIIFKAEDN